MALINRRRTVYFPHAHEIIRGRDTVLQAPMYVGSVLTAPTGGGTSTVTIYDATNTAVVTAATVVVVGDIGQYTISADTFDDFGKGWRVAWLLDDAGTTVEAENDAVLARKLLYPVVSLQNLFQEIPQLNPAVSGQPLTRYTIDELQDQGDLAWTELMQRFINEGFRPEWTRSPSSLAGPHQKLWIAHILSAEAILSSDDRLREDAKRYRGEYQTAYSQMTMETDRNQDGAADSNSREHPAGGGLWFGNGA